MSKSALNTAGNLAYAAKSIYKIIKAFLRGGWYAAAEVRVFYARAKTA